ncbi:ATP-binding protein [Hydrocarboniphaga effusa]|uniref:sensor histidine kinase n=2 Tax=Hydrocarboniphaga effusa TaxID=243629 RepID=UPI0035B02E40
MPEEPLPLEQQLKEGPAGQILVHLATPVWLVDLDPVRVVWGNRAAAELLRQPSVEALCAYDFGPFEAGDVARLHHLRRQLELGETPTASWVTHANGARIALQCHFAPYRLADGRNLILVEAHEAAGPASLIEDLRSIESFRHSSPLTLMVSMDGDVALANPAAIEALPMLRRSGARWQDLFEDAEAGLGLLEEAAAHGGMRSEFSLHTDNGDYWYMADLRLARDPSDGEHCLVVTLSDLSERQQLEQRVRESESSIRQAMELAPVPLLILSSFGKSPLYANAAALRLFATDARQLPDDSRKLIQLNGAVMRDIFDTLRNGQTYGPRDARLFVAEGRQLTLRITAQTLTYDGELAMILSLVDVDELRQAEARLNGALERERDLNRLQKQLVSVVSHELRTPLAVMDSSVQRVLRHHQDWPADETSERLRQLRQKIERLSTLAERLLDSARLDEGKVAFQPQPFNLVQLIDKVIEQQAELAPLNQIQFSFDGLPAEINADPQLIEQVLTNLVGNAVKYSPGGTPVCVQAHRGGDYAVIEVSDRGLGIPLHEQPQVFERFFRASTTLDIRGTGLGLYITRQLVELHGGRIELHSEAGVGTTMTVYLPL